MGRRTGTTKSGRFMNPADQARKQERKRELKKNKKQRVHVRQAVLKSKDPEDLIAQMNKMDEMEFDADGRPMLAPRVVQEKRQKLRETFLRVLGMYKRDGQNEKVADMKKKLQQYDLNRTQLEQNFAAVKFANEANPAEIPLPDGAAMPGAAMTPQVPQLGVEMPPGRLPFPPHMLLPDFNARPAMGVGTGGILKRPERRFTSEVPPGTPCGLPPEFSDSDDYDSDSDGGDAGEERRGHVRFEGVADEEKDSRTKYKLLAKKLAAGEQADDSDEDEDFSSGHSAALRMGPIDGAAFAPTQQRLTRPPPPPPGLPPQMANRRFPPPPPPLDARPPRPSFGAQPVFVAPPPTSAAVISAAPTVLRKGADATTIEAKPLLRNMQREVTRLVPTAVKVRRDAQKKPTKSGVVAGGGVSSTSTGQVKRQPQQKSSDDAYGEFMKEMQGLL